MAVRSRGRTTIVPPEQLLSRQEILDEDFTVLTLIPSINGDELSKLEWLARRRLIRNSSQCGICDNACALNRYSRGIDKWQWRCNTHNYSQSVRDGSFFSGSRLSLTKLILVAYFWSEDLPQSFIMKQIGMRNRKTIIDWINILREVCEHHLEHNPQEIGGFDETGDPVVVEIDESKFFHRKYHRGEWREGHLVFGGVERVSGKCFLVEVENRRAETLLPTIERWILPGSHIISDNRHSYGRIEQFRNGIYQHSVVVHQQNFVDSSDDQVHTQNVENLWMRAKRKLRRQCRTNKELFTLYIHEFIWRNKFKEKLFQNLILSISDIHKV